MGGSSNIASYYVKATAGSFVSPASNIVSSNVLFYKRTNELLPEKYSLEQNYPNPFNPSTSISYSIPENAFVTLKIYDVLGNEVEVLINEQKESGNYQIDFNASSVSRRISSGIYYYTLTAGNFTSTKKMILIK